VGVSQSSVNTWVRDIDLTDDQHAVLRLKNRIYDGQLKGRAIAAANRRAERLAAQESGRVAAPFGDPIFIGGCLLYWAEGTKNRNQLRFSNSDPEMGPFLCLILRMYFDLSAEDIGITCHLYADHEERQCETEGFWLTLLDLPRSSRPGDRRFHARRMAGIDACAGEQGRTP
jgi:hypothetical protein